MLVAQAEPGEFVLLQEALDLLARCEAAQALSEEGADVIRWLRQ